MKKLKGKATILFDRDRGLNIELEDELSGTTIRAQLSPDNAIAALARMGYVDCEITYPKSLSKIGMKRERKRVTINKTWTEWKPTREIIEQQCIADGVLTDGFYLSDTGLSTQQNIAGKHGVILERFVEA